MAKIVVDTENRTFTIKKDWNCFRKKTSEQKVVSFFKQSHVFPNSQILSIFVSSRFSIMRNCWAF